MEIAAMPLARMMKAVMPKAKVIAWLRGYSA
jgi:hypothetical protein